ncbi:MAG: hypothetical protein QOE61_1409, partial [Micromonosporaceae bacterium]|nr:hypothetical protein [Micromonosporaceae bacterium]
MIARWLRMVRPVWGVWPLIRRRWNAVPAGLVVAVLNTTIAWLVAATAALLSLVLGDVLPAQGPWQVVWSRLWWLLAALVLLAAAVVVRGRVHTRRGTLFYVRLLDDPWTDLHVQALRAAQARRMSLRSVTRWVDLPARTTAIGVIDIVEECAQVAVALEATVNDDRDDTGYTLAPNMAWPVALAVGAELPILRRLELVELDEHTVDAETRFELPAATDNDGLLLSDDYTVARAVAGTGRAGLLLAFSRNAKRIDPDAVFADCGVSDYRRVRPYWVGPDLTELATAHTPDQLRRIAAALPGVVAQIKNDDARELVVVAALPKTVAVALGWGLAQGNSRFFDRTHLLNWAD